jgi:DNA-binding transcriptional LysR family regulator
MLRQQELDIVICLKAAVTQEPDLIEETLSEDEIGIFVRQGHRLLERADHSLASIATTEKWTIPLNGELYSAMRKHFESTNIPIPAARLETGAVLVIKWLTRETDRLALCTPQVLEPELKEGSVRALKGRWRFPASRMVLYRRRDNTPSRATLALIQCIKRAASTRKMSG